MYGDGSKVWLLSTVSQTTIGIRTNCHRDKNVLGRWTTGVECAGVAFAYGERGLYDDGFGHVAASVFACDK